MAYLARAALPWRTPIAAALLTLAIGVLLHGGLLEGRSTTLPTGGLATKAQAGLWRLPAAARGPVSSALGAQAPAYRITPSAAGGLRASNPAQALGISFTASGVTLSATEAQASLRLAAIGYGSTLTSLPAAAPSARANRVSYSRGIVSEWYANGPLGLEQGFTVARPHAPARARALTLSLVLGGSLPALSADGRTIMFGSGPGALRYSGLSAIDARGRALRAELALKGDRLLLRVDTHGARFPVRIDPLIQEGTRFTGNDLAAPSQLGTSVALSADGNTLLVGGSEDASLDGAAWVFTRTGSTWRQQGEKLTGGKEETPGGQFGASVALSGDGNTALIGAYTDASGDGGAWVFTRSGFTWTQQGEKLTGGKEETAGGRFGRSVALSSDGNTALIGAYFDHGQRGGAFAFSRASGVWSQQGEKLTGVSDEEGEGQFGFATALSSDGNTALIGGPHDVTEKGELGAAWVFTRSGGSWSQQGGKLRGTGEVGQGELGSSVALSADGNTALAGGLADNSGVGGAWVFTRAGAIWSQQGAKLVASDASGPAGFGAGVALSADGETALIGGPFDMPGKAPEGAAWEFARSGATWSQQGPKLRGTGQIGEGEFGIGIALSADGDSGIVGAPLDGADAGFVYPFVDTPPPVTTGSASAVGFTSATLNGLLGAGASNTVFFEYGATKAYGSSTIRGSLARAGVTRTVSTPLTGLLLGTTIHFRLVAENSAGSSFGADQSFTTGFPIGKEAPPLPPIIEGLSQSHAVWRVGRHAARLSRRRAPLGTTFTVKLSEASSLSLAFTQRLPGRRVRRRCLAPSAHNRHRRSCKRTLTRGVLSLPAHAGVNKVLFQGAIAHNHTLKPGTYVVRVSARSARGLLSETRTLRFRITR